MSMIDVLHQHGIGVILDWVPSHFPDDPHGLAKFDGTHLYEHADPRLGFHPEWKSAIFNYGRHEVRAFLMSSAHFWLEKYHIDGLRVDAVASMLYLDYGRKDGEWIPNAYGVMGTHPGKKVLFMGGQFGQWREWHHERELDWDLTVRAEHSGLQRWVADLNRAYCDKPALHQLDFERRGFEWIDNHDSDNSILTFLRLGEDGRAALVACNFTPVVRYAYRVGVPCAGTWREILNSDAPFYGGSGVGNMGSVVAESVAWHGREHSALLTLPPLAMVVLEPGDAA